ncbi:protein of unknown function [Xenorhabdus bovienii]|uniref:Uncharacterized protein n=1 Tax=Xenorhabdus bovienii TaxID=40576 RepID=A0A0B6XEJ5_XENBV|nr:protein of unknown function [Xenorhabdus bovienii]
MTITAIDVNFGHVLPLKGGKPITITNYLIHDPKLDISKIRKSFQDKENKWIEYPNGEIKYEKK